VASNQHQTNGALHAAQSGLECAKYMVKTVTGLLPTNSNTVTPAQATLTWNSLCSYVNAPATNGTAVSFRSCRRRLSHRA